MPQWDQTGQNWEITAEDRRMLAEYEAWLPDKIFDARPLFTRPPTAPSSPSPPAAALSAAAGPHQRCS